MVKLKLCACLKEWVWARATDRLGSRDQQSRPSSQSPKPVQLQLMKRRSWRRWRLRQSTSVSSPLPSIVAVWGSPKSSSTTSWRCSTTIFDPSKPVCWHVKRCSHLPGASFHRTLRFNPSNNQCVLTPEEKLRYLRWYYHDNTELHFLSFMGERGFL